MRLIGLISILAALVAPAGVSAQLPVPVPAPVPPPVATPPLPPLPLPPVPLPPPPVSVAPVQPPAAVSAIAPVHAPATGAAVESPVTPVAGAAAARPTSSTVASRPRPAARVRKTIVLGFRLGTAERLRIRITQIAPVCRTAGRLVVDARAGRNRVRFAGRVRGRRLPDGTYVATTPSGDVRFAIVRGKPTKDPKRLAPSVCRSSVAVEATGGVARRAAPPRNDRSTAVRADDSRLRDLPAPFAHVLGTSVSRAADAALSLHPAFYLLLALAIAALAVATVPLKVVPAPVVGTLLARRRAEITLAGTLALLAVLVAYWLVLRSG